ncbi:MAG: RuBisCO large subunit C-terminal-like domain-containing protein [Myxococcota bacterium]|jgi:ribulose-bisphosphate carboxylase large chain|nr:ribulose 1,5-bisphosphate carboxylase large subunit [Myxococcota bacterium]MBP8970469.1 ribulose 1,5-bisphosphate carboxylase large subunit [Myxococcota bacterium]HHW97344.1 ribulose 1,5-bisphosphate carboxylase large subunit [Oligoflexales bacterium]HQC44096.1 RuBisCO large subunit C-terminal-like domain-containing protein [Myxococcota bacterium]HQL56930.1 RuBisCO large subunit C-terminal-like domain-containing protein [Myxococcota bacterium]
MPASFGDGLDVIYLVKSIKDQIEAVAHDIAVEQTVEVTAPLYSDPFISTNVVGRVVDISQVDEDLFQVTISYAGAVIGLEITQLISVIFGNVSLKKGIRVKEILPSATLADRFAGPKFGIAGLRSHIGVPDRPLVIGAIKPLGRTVDELAQFARGLAGGGLDLIKDDHGITDQAFAPYRERVAACAKAVAQANSETGFNTLYCPTVTGPADQMMDRAKFAKDVGAGGVLISPLVAGWDFMRAISKQTGLPIIAHPALAGAYLAPDHGISHGALFGTLMRMTGADLVVFPGFGGRFPLTQEHCREINVALKCKLHQIRDAFPVPAGGLTLERVGEIRSVFGNDVAFLIGSAVYERSPDLAANATYFRGLAAAWE